MSDFQKWSVLAFRAMDDAARVLIIEAAHGIKEPKS